jgi:hypothetical protein
MLLVVVSVVLVMFLPGGDDRPTAPASYMPRVGSLGDKLSRAIPGNGDLSLREDFRTDLRNWQGDLESSMRDGWTRTGQAMQVGKLRLWKPTLALSDYNLRFGAEIEHKAVSWAFRATDGENYYATKIYVNGSGEGRGGGAHRAEIIRYIVRDGKQMGKVQLPIPVVIREHMPYDISVRVKGDRFITMVDGRLVDSWTDRTFRRGGVGFFSEGGEMALLKWVSLSEGESFLKRFLSFSLLITPIDLRPGERQAAGL